MYWWKGGGLLFPQERRNYIGFINYNDVCNYFLPLGTYVVPKVSYNLTMRSRNNWVHIVFVLSQLVFCNLWKKNGELDDKSF